MNRKREKYLALLVVGLAVLVLATPPDGMVLAGAPSVGPVGQAGPAAPKADTQAFAQLYMTGVAAQPGGPGQEAASPDVAKTLDRDIEPVVVIGSAVRRFLGVPVDELFVYAYNGVSYDQIPSQVDEVTAAGDYIAYEDGLLDENDQIVFMAKDTGDLAPPENPIGDALPISRLWYETEVTDPLNPSQQGWAYLVHSTELERIADDYVDFEPTPHRIQSTSNSYSLGLAQTFPGFDYLALGGSGTDILDRTKIRAKVPLTVLTENDLQSPGDGLIKDGTVRVIVRDGRGFGYGSMLVWTIHIPAIPLLSWARFSTDWSGQASGSTLYNAAAPGGVTVNGVSSPEEDQIPLGPLSEWFQLSTNHGSLVQAGDTARVGGERSNYYWDKGAVKPPDSEDTGDGLSYGDTGVHVDNPNSSGFDYPFNIYFLPANLPNAGEQYMSYFSNPLNVTANLVWNPSATVYLPVILRAY